MIYKYAVIGGGASALMFVANLKDKKNALILEQNETLGKKILISGGGRCNFANKNLNCNNYLGDCNFLKQTFKNFNQKFIINYFTSKGLKYSIKNNTQLFCQNSSKELLDILISQIKGSKVKLNTKVLNLNKQNDLFLIKTNKGEFKAKKVIICSGGISYEQVGVSKIAFEIAKKYDIKINPLKPALTGLTLQKEQSFLKELSGISFLGEVCVNNRCFLDNILLTHKGLSGPAILNASLFWDKGKILINFLPKFNFEKLNKNKRIISQLPLPKRLSSALLEHINLENKEIFKLNDAQLNKLKNLQKYTFAPAGTFGFKKAEITKGGIKINQINPLTFESLKVKNLYFLGEVLDIGGTIGGYNFMFAFSSALNCAKNIS
jgi:predicted Rossmann fold flavoprotein